MRAKPHTLIPVLTLTSVLLLPTFSGAVDLDVSSDTVTIEDLTPGGEVAISWAGKIGGVVPTSYWQTRILTDEDFDGSIAIEDLDPVAINGSIWAVADIRSGNYKVMRLLGPATEPADLTERAQSAGWTLEPAEIVAASGSKVTLMLIRGGVGVWHAEVYDGTENDLDGTSNAAVATNCALLKAGERGPATPITTQSGDILISVDSYHLSVTVSTVS